MPANLPFQESLSPEMILHIDGLCDQFESDLQAGRQPGSSSCCRRLPRRRVLGCSANFSIWKFAIVGKADVR